MTRRLVAALCVAAILNAPAHAEEAVRLYAAGSLRA
jgi:hypothetical protein